MEIRKRLITSGAKEVNAVLIYDEGEEYPVFLESLHNTIMFPTLIESGYVLESLPYGFVKNGVSFDQLPVENYTLNDVQEEMMYNSIGVKLPHDEIKKHIVAGVAKGLPQPATAYTIFTREDFLKYLDATAVASLDDDYMPLNYFVAPEARFSIKEYKDPSNLNYVQLINNRRNMSLKKFTKLVTALLKINLPVNYTSMDVLDAYFAWGMDGLDMPIINKRRESRPFRLTTNRNVTAPMVNKTYGYVDGMQNLLTPKNQRDVAWRLSNKDPQFLSAITSGMQMNDTRLVEFSVGTKQEITILEGTEFNIQYSDETLIMQLQSYPPIRVESPISVGEYIDLKLALPNNREKLYEHCTIDALARMLYTYRKPTVKVSSFDALKIAGCNPRTVLDYITTKYDMSKEQNALTEDAAPQIFDFDINNYLAGNSVSEDIKLFLDDVVNGVFNIDEIGQGKQAEASVNTVSVYREIYALHHVMGISLQDIYDKFRTITSDTKSLTFTDGDIQHTIDVSPLIYSTVGYKHDLMRYDLDNARDCTFFTYVNLIAREAGDERADKHVGIEFFLVNKRHSAVKEVLSDLTKKFEDKVTSMISDVTKQAGQMRLVNMFALSRYFEIAFKGTITWPAILGGNVEPALPSTVQTCRKYLERKIENITAFCSFTANTASARNLTFNAYCTNAYITPEYVIPRSDTPIKELPFYSVWFDWKNKNPEIWKQLVDNNVLTVDFEAWESRYATEQFVQRDLFELDAPDSLLYYYNHAIEEVKNYPADKDFIAVTHPMQYMFPGLYAEGESYDNCETLAAPRTSDPVIRLGLCRDITKDTYSSKLLPSEILPVKDSYIRQYKGFEASTLILVPDVFNKIPDLTDADLTVMPESESVYVSDTNQVINFRRILELDFNKYPISHICDRDYLLRSADGKLWEVRI